MSGFKISFQNKSTLSSYIYRILREGTLDIQHLTEHDFVFSRNKNADHRSSQHCTWITGKCYTRH